MKKKLKRLIALFMLIAFNLNTYAAVGSNDSSGFVTKAEFDAFVENFNEEMNDFENGLNSRIDSSIANYIVGLGRDVIKANMIINNAQKSQVYKFMIWSDPGCATTGRQISASGTISSQVDGQAKTTQEAKQIIKQDTSKMISWDINAIRESLISTYILLG